MAEDTSQALAVLRETVPAVEKAGQTGVGPNQVSPLDAWLADIWGYYPWGEDKPLSLDEALQISAVLIALDVLSQDIAKAPLQLRRKLPGGGSIVVEPKEHWFAKMLALEPNPWHTWGEMISMMVLHLGAVQNAFVAKKYRRNGEVEMLIPLLPGRIRIFVDEERQQYLYDVERLTPNERMMLRGMQDVLLNDEVMHFRGRVYDGLFGYSTLDAGAKTMGLARALQDYQTRLYKSDGAMRGVFEMPKEQDKPLSDPVFKRLKEQLSARHAAARENGIPIILEQGMSYRSVSMNASEAEIAKSIAGSIEDVARMFRIPPHKLMHLTAVKYENLEQLEKQYVHESLIPICQRLEERMTRSLLGPDDRLSYYLQFDREALVLTDVEKQAEIMKVLMDRGAMTLNEARQKRGMNPLPDDTGNVRLIPANYHLVDDANEVVIQAGKPDGSGTADQPAEDAAKSAEVLRLVSASA